jgi:type II secretory ATPase GspE/PulE/Tfp pilus assembly ATPase PilB-like protein
MQVSDRQLSDFLFDAGLLPRRELERAARLASEREESLSQTLVGIGLVSDDDLRRAVARMLGVQFVLLSKDMFDARALELLPEAFSRTHNVLALSSDGTTLEVALLDLESLAAVREYVGPTRTVVPRLTNRQSLTHGLLHYQRHLKEQFGARIAAELAVMQQAHHAGDMARATDAAVRAADALLQHALNQRAHELHLESYSTGVRVRYRIQHALHDAFVLPAHAASFLVARFKSLAQMPHTRVPHVGRFKFSIDGASSQVGVTVASVPTHNGEKLLLSFAHAGSDKHGLSLSSLGLTPGSMNAVRKLLTQRGGLLLVCGKEGAGKTTMLYTLLDELADPSKNIASVETHVSFELPAVSQMEVHSQLGLSPASCIRTQLRHNPDVLLIDTELDEEAALLAAQAANRGVFVLLGVESPTAAEGIERLRSLIPADMLAATLAGSIGVERVPTLCSNSKEPYRLARVERTLLEDTSDIKTLLTEVKEDQIVEPSTAWKDIPFYSAQPCKECSGGYAGQTGLQEIIPNSLVLKDMIAAGADARQIMHEAQREGAILFARDALYKAVQGIVSIETAVAVAAQ